MYHSNRKSFLPTFTAQRPVRARQAAGVTGVGFGLDANMNVHAPPRG